MYAFHGNAPLLEVAMSFIVMGCACYMLWARTNGFWPYGPEALDSDEEGLDHLVVYVDDGKYNDEFGMLKKRVTYHVVNLREEGGRFSPIHTYPNLALRFSRRMRVVRRVDQNVSG